MARLLGVLAAVLATVLMTKAAPVPKSLKGKVPNVTGTTWVSNEDEARLGVIEYTFHDGGKLTWKSLQSGNTYTAGTWKQDGDKLWWEVNQRYVDYNVTYADGRFDGSALNKVQLRWSISLKPKGKE